uniref:Thiamine-triphosphatase n=1 Tax=Xenopus tropicalis TaxID=8364 RepID=A0A803K671_XENTR
MQSPTLSSGPIEVERKFVPGPQVEDELLRLGAKLQNEITFRDSYYDTPDCRLTLGDVWLRRREDSWELKYPPQRGTRGLNGASTQYLELSCEADITRRVSEELNIPCPHSLDLLQLQEFASFVTRRRRFEFPPRNGSKHKVVVDLDTADFDFSVGEVEVLVKTQEEVKSALMEVEEICKQLGKIMGLRFCFTSLECNTFIFCN